MEKEKVVLTEEQKKKVAKLLSTSHAHQDTIEVLSILSHKAQEKAFEHIFEWYPELKGKQISICNKSGTIGIEQ